MKRAQPTLSASLPSDFRIFLRDELLRRTRANPRYSLRSFSKLLGIQSSFLSKLLRGDRRVTSDTVRKLGSKLGLDPQQLEYFDHAHSKKTQKTNTATLERPNDFRQITLDHFQVIADWYHFAILELATIQGFNPAPKWMARKLGITVHEVNAALERLARLDYIEMSSTGHWKVIDENTTTLGTDLTNAALRKLQKQVLEMAIEALESTPPELRDQSAITMAIDSSLIPQAKQMIKNFRRSLNSFLEEGRKKDSVYQLSVSLYPLTQNSQRNL